MEVISLRKYLYVYNDLIRNEEINKIVYKIWNRNYKQGDCIVRKIKGEYFLLQLICIDKKIIYANVVKGVNI